jgi:hypothetical protein
MDDNKLIESIDLVYSNDPEVKEKEKLTRYKASLMTSLPVSPEQATKQYQLSKQTGIPVGIVRAKENEIAQRTELATFEDEDFINNFPQVVAQLSNPNISGAIKDDVDSLSKFERIANSTKEKYQQSALMDETVDLRFRRIFANAGKVDEKLSPSEEALVSEFERQQPKNYNLGFKESIIPETVGALRTSFGVVKEAGPRALGIATLGGLATGAITKTPAGFAKGFKATLGLSAPASIALSMGKLEAASAGDELMTVVDENGKPLEPEIILGASLLTGAINGAIETVPVKIGFGTIRKAFAKEGVKELVKNSVYREYFRKIGNALIKKASVIPGSKQVAKLGSNKIVNELVKNTAKGGAIEGSTEALQSLVNIIVAEGAKSASKGDFKPFGMENPSDIEGFLRFASEKAPEVGESFIAGGAAGTGISAVGGGAIAGRRVYDRRKQNEKEKGIISELNQVASQSKVLKRDADLFKEATKETLGKVDFYIPAEEAQTYFQDKPEAFEKFLQIPQVKEQFEEALELGGDLIIPANEIYANSQINPDIAGLEDFARLSAESFSQLEAQSEFFANVIPEMVAEEQEILRNRERNEIKLNIRKQISNLIPTKEQDDYIKLLENYYDTRAKRYGNEAAKQILESYLGQLELNQKKFQKPSPFRRIEDLDLMIDRARKPIKQPKPSKPLLKTLREMGGVRTGSNLAGELNAIGVNPQTAPTLFRKDNGLGDIDNIPISEFQNKFPNVQAVADETGNYVDRNYLLNLLSEEQFGNDITLTKTEEQTQVEDFLQGLDELGIDLKASNEEIKKAIKKIQEGTYNQTQDQTKTPAFKKWFGDSKVVDENGEPLVVYHGTDKEFKKFDKKKTIGGQFWFTNKKDLIEKGEVGAAGKGRIIESYLSIKNPAGWNEYDKLSLDQIIQQGFDGIILEESDQNTYIAFEPTQIKSVENKGTFDPENPNIYYQQQEPILNQKKLKDIEEENYLTDLNNYTSQIYRQSNVRDALQLMPNSPITARQYDLFFSNTKNLALGQETNKDGIILGFSTNDIRGQVNRKKPFWKELYKNNEAEFVAKYNKQELYQNNLNYIEIPSELKVNKNDLALLKLTLKQLENLGWKKNKTIDSIQYTKSLELFQNASSPQGQTQFIGQKPVVTLFEKADRSTLLHELGHVFLQIEADVAKLPNMPADFKKDWATLENWLGVKDGVITREAHEKFARGFEAYLREGKAPSLELRGAFRRFKAWLGRIYTDVLQLNVKLNNDIRGYFDKLLATDEAIEAQRNNPIFATDSNVLELLTKKEQEDYIKLSDNAKEKTKEELLKKAFKQSEIQTKKFYKEELANVKKEIQEELDQDKTYRVLTYLKTGKINGEEQPRKIKLSREDVKNNYDGEFIKYLPKSIFGKDGVEVDFVADEFGFKSGSEMLYSIANAPDYKARVDELAEQEMVRRYGDIMKDGTIEREAIEMAENDARAKKIVYELNAINRKVRTITESKEAYKQKAKEIIEGKNLVEATNTNKYYINALKAARESGKYLGKKDYEKAVEWKKKQLLNHYLFRESKALRDEIETSKKRYDKYKKKPTKGKVRIDEDYRTRIVNLLQDFGLANKPVDYAQTNIIELENWKKEKQNEGVLGLVEFPEIANFQGKSFNQLTVEEYRILDNSIENLAHIGESERFIEVEGKRVELATLSEELSENIRSNLKERPKIIGSKTKTEELKDKFDEANSTITKAKNIALKLDGEKVLGKFYNAFIKPVGNQELVRNEMIKEASDKLNEIFDKYLSKLSKKREYFEEVNTQLSRQNLIAIALNWGNDINKKRIKDGFGWTDQQVVSLLSNLTSNELNYVQEIWDYLDGFWEKSSSLHKKLLGFAPKKQRFAPLKIKTSDGQEVSLKGGYYPIAYSKESNLRKGDLDDYQQVSINYEQSYLKERTDKKVDKDLTLTLTPLYTHVSKVVNDLAMKEATWNSDKVLKSRKVENAITSTAGVNQYLELKSWLQDLFGVAQTPAGWLGASINHLRAGMTISTMGLKASSVIIQASGYAQSIVKIGYTPMLKGLFKFLGNGNLLNVNKSMNEAVAKSKILKTRETTYHRDIFETLRSMEKKGKLPKNLVAYYFYPMAKMQMMVDIPTWYGAYYKGLKDFNGDDAKAVDYADLMVVQSQGSGLMQDLASFERGSIGGQRKSELIKMFTAFYTYFNAKWNLAQESYRRTNFRKPSDIAKFASDMMLLYFVEALIGEAILGRLPDFDDEDEDTFAAYSAKLVASNFFAQFPISREAVSGLKGFDVSPAGFSGLASITKGGAMIAKELQEEEVDITKIIEGLNQGGGVLFHYPSGQVDVFIDAVQKAQEGEDVAPINYLLRDYKK